MATIDILKKSSVLILVLFSYNCNDLNIFSMSNLKTNNQKKEMKSSIQNNDTIFSKDFDMFSFKEIDIINTLNKSGIYLKIYHENDYLNINVVSNNNENNNKYLFNKEANYYTNFKEDNESGLRTCRYTIYKENIIYKFFLHKLPSRKYFSLTKFEEIKPVLDFKQVVTVKKIFEEIEVADMNNLINYIQIERNKYETEIYEYYFDYKKEEVKQYLMNNDGTKEYYYTYRIGNSKSIGSPLYDIWTEI